MSCPDCEAAQELRLGEEPTTFVRVGNGNVALIGCTRHESELIRNLRGFLAWDTLTKRLRGTCEHEFTADTTGEWGYCPRCGCVDRLAPPPTPDTLTGRTGG